jgi:acetylornithine/succinyldiaminopimelate/putrescine aminotransferase
MTLIGHDPKPVITQRFARHVSSGKVAFYEQAGIDFVLGRRDGIYVWDLDGQRLINAHCNGGVFNLGHRHPRIVAALRAALDEGLDIGNHHLVSEMRARLAERLAALSRGDLKRVVFGVSGGEAIDLAIKLARGHTRRAKVVSAVGGYHGHTGLALAAGDELYRAPFGPTAPGFAQVPFGDLDALAAEMDEDTAAVIFETIPATLGIAIPPEDFYAGVRGLCDQHGALMIADEVQTGLGRCGAAWGIDTYGVVPDIVVTGKGLSGGLYPMSATLYREHLNPILHANPFIHVSTFGGSELGCAVSLAVLDLLAEPGFLEHVRAVAEIFRSGFAALQARHPIVAETRQRGLMMGLKLASPRLGPAMSQLGFRRGLLAIYANHDPAVLQVLPPLIITPEQAQELLSLLDGMLSELEAQFAGRPQ